MRRLTLAAILAGAAVVATGCTTHIAPYKPKKRQMDFDKYDPAPTPTGASLWSDSQAGFFEDNRARRVGDILVVRIDEQDTASRDDTTALDKKSSMDMGASSILGFMPALQAKFPGVNPASLLSTSSSQSFNGSGRIQRSGRMEATLPVRIKKVLPNQDLYIEGTKVVMIGREEQHLYLSGVIRAADIDADDTVRSSRIAEAEIELVGRGDVSEQQRPGWFVRALTKINPF